MDILTIEKIKQLEAADLNRKITEIKKLLFDLRFKQATRQTVKTHLFKQYKRMLAQMLTTASNYQNHR